MTDREISFTPYLDSVSKFKCPNCDICVRLR